MTNKHEAGLSFPVPTQQNPQAVYTSEKSEILLPSSETSSFAQEKHKILQDLHHARLDNRLKTAEDFKRKRDFEACKRTWKQEEDRERKEAQKQELVCLGLPESHAYLLEPSYIAMSKHYRHQEEEDFGGDGVDLNAKVYHKSLKRILSISQEDEADPKARLSQDLNARMQRNVKSLRTGNGNDGINKQNAIFNKSLNRSMAKDTRVQTIKQNLERGTAL